MKKKIILSFLVIVFLVSITGCRKSDDYNLDNFSSVVKIGDDEIKLSYETNLKNMYYKENISLFNSDTLGSNRLISYQKNNKVIFEIRMAYIENKTMDETKEEVNFVLSPRKINDIEYQYGEWILNDANTGEDYNVNEYFFEYKGTTYTICFISNENIKDFENTFMNNIYFK